MFPVLILNRREADERRDSSDPSGGRGEGGEELSLVGPLMPLTATSHITATGPLTI